MAYPIIMNGDHAEFEAQQANARPEDRPDWPLPSFAAQDWAGAFVKMHGGDEGLMLTWFANALMRGYDERVAQNVKVSEMRRAGSVPNGNQGDAA